VRSTSLFAFDVCERSMTRVNRSFSTKTNATTLSSSPLPVAIGRIIAAKRLLQKAQQIFAVQFNIDGKKAICLLNGLLPEKGPQDAPRPPECKCGGVLVDQLPIL
jgi:hypothetical protein